MFSITCYNQYPEQVYYFSAETRDNAIDWRNAIYNAALGIHPTDHSIHDVSKEEFEEVVDFDYGDDNKSNVSRLMEERPIKNCPSRY